MRALVLRNISIEGPGTFGALLATNGFSLTDIDLSKGDPCPATAEGYDLVLVMGGPMNVYEEAQYPFLTNELSLIQECIASKRKLIGFCLGGQMIARALGAKVTKNRVKEIGWMPVELTPGGKAEPLMAGLPDSFTVFQWHGDTFGIPQGASHLARSADCEHQAFRHGNALALQFHPEADESDPKTWGELYINELMQEKGVHGLAQLMAQTRREYPRMQKERDRFYANLLRWIREG